MITGSFSQDIECLMELDIIDDLPETDSESDKTIIKSVMAKNNDSTPNEKLNAKFQIYMLLVKDNDNSTILHFACLLGSKLIEFIVE